MNLTALCAQVTPQDATYAERLVIREAVRSAAVKIVVEVQSQLLREAVAFDNIAKPDSKTLSWSAKRFSAIFTEYATNIQ